MPMLCGTTITLSGVALGEILDVRDLGATRKAVDATDSGEAGGWGKVFYSCIARLKPFRVTLGVKPDLDWGAEVKLEPGDCVVTIPEEDATPAETCTFTAAITDTGISGELEGRITRVVEITPSGAPVFAAVP